MKSANLGLFLFKIALCLSLLIITIGCADHAETPSTGTLRLYNESTVTIDYFYLSPASQTKWGNNLLPAPLSSNHIADILNLSPGVYDAKVTVIGQFSTYSTYSYDFWISEGFMSELTVVDSSFSGSLKIVNNTGGATIIALYVVPASATSWGVNQLSSPVAPSGSVHLYDMIPDVYDIRVVWNVGADSFYYNIPVDSLTLTTQNVI
jgi:hypothetical protein